MIYTATSIQEVIGRVIRNTRVQDTYHIASMNEWIPEAMGYMRTKVVLTPRWKCVPIEFHKGRMPCGLRNILAIEWNGARLKYYNGVQHPTAPSSASSTGSTTLFGTTIVPRETVTGGIITETQLDALREMRTCDEWYFSELDWINTSFKDGWVVVHYNALPLDAEGLPLIPDNENYKEAIYWYCREKMIGAGYKDTVYSPQYCTQKFELHAARAMGEIRYPSVDQVHSRMLNMTRLVMPEDYWDKFFGEQGSGSVAAPTTKSTPSNLESNGWDQTEW